MRTLTMTVWERPEYLKQTLASLAKNDFMGFDKLFFGIEPGNKEVLEICKSVDFIETDLHVNTQRLGVRNNPFMTLRRAFSAGSELNIYLEDDVLVSPDITRMALWYDSLQDKEDYACLNFWRKETSNSLEEVLENGNRFSALGLVMTRRQWHEFFKPNWHTDWRGWDHSIIEHMKQIGAKNLCPATSRSKHIGRFHATHYVPQVHDKIHLSVNWNEEKKQVSYRLKK